MTYGHRAVLRSAAASLLLPSLLADMSTGGAKISSVFRFDRPYAQALPCNGVAGCMPATRVTVHIENSSRVRQRRGLTMPSRHQMV